MGKLAKDCLDVVLYALNIAAMLHSQYVARITLSRVFSWYGENHLSISVRQLEVELLRLQAKVAENEYCYHVAEKDIFCWKQEIDELSCGR